VDRGRGYRTGVAVRAAGVPAPIDAALAAALGTEDPADVGEVVATLESLARRLRPGRAAPGRS
jgi:hypothetical protein